LWLLRGLDIELLNDQPLPLLVIYPKETTANVHIKTCTWMFIAALPMRAKEWRQSNIHQLMNVQRKKLWHTDVLQNMRYLHMHFLATTGDSDQMFHYRMVNEKKPLLKRSMRELTRTSPHPYNLSYCHRINSLKKKCRNCWSGSSGLASMRP
jgi:hypothetical protein